MRYSNPHLAAVYLLRLCFTDCEPASFLRHVAASEPTDEDELIIASEPPSLWYWLGGRW